MWPLFVVVPDPAADHRSGLAQRFDVPLIVLRGISDGKAELHHIDDWIEYLDVIDEKLASAVDPLGEALANGLLER